MKVELNQQAQIKALVKTVQPRKSYRELAATYTGKEDKLICNLTAQADKEAQEAKVRSLVDSAQPGKIADELLVAYSEDS